MPRMSKKRKLEWSFFLSDRKRITYNELCPHYLSKRAIKPASENEPTSEEMK